MYLEARNIALMCPTINFIPDNLLGFFQNVFVKYLSDANNNCEDTTAWRKAFLIGLVKKKTTKKKKKQQVRYSK